MTNKTAHPEKYLPLEVGNMAFMLDRLGKDCAPLQYLRELTQNSIEAIQRTKDGEGEIHWDVDWNRFDLHGDGIYKLAIIDNGDGMTGQEMVEYINKLSSSISEQSLHGNYGIGAKIAAATQNPFGLIYLSWKNGYGAMIHLARDPVTGEYGLRELECSDGSYDYWAPIEDAVKPDLIDDHGTMVVLLGKVEDEHTIEAPAEITGKSRWIAKYLNTRYFRFPTGITIRAREGWDHPRTDNDRNLLRKVIGQEQYLSQHAQEFGDVELSDATAHWWILKDEDAIYQNSGFVHSSGHIGALYREELYEVSTSKTGYARLQHFGVTLGYKRVVIYIEPHETRHSELTTNTARNQLLINGEPLPWTKWAEEFRDNLPLEISTLIEELASQSKSENHQDAIRKRLDQIRELFKFSRYRRSSNGNMVVNEDYITQGGKSDSKNNSKNHGHTKNGGTGGRAGDVYAIFTAEKGEQATRVNADPYPDVTWVTAEDGTREPGFLDDKAACYLPDQNMIQINADFRVFQDMIQRYKDAYEGKPGASQVVEEVVREWFEQQLVETVLGIQSLEDSPEWRTREIDQAFSEEALTAAVMPRYQIDHSINRTLGSRLGSKNK